MYGCVRMGVPFSVVPPLLKHAVETACVVSSCLRSPQPYPSPGLDAHTAVHSLSLPGACPGDGVT